MSEKYEELRKRVQDTESQLHDIVGDSVGRWFARRHEECEYEQLVELLYNRSKLLDEMFVATPEEVTRMEQVNARLLDFTDMMFARTEALYRKTMSATYDSAFDNDVDVEGTLKFELNEPNSILPMSNDAYYGSDFAFVFDIIGCLYTHNYLRREEIESSYCYCPPSGYSADMSREDMQIAENLNDGNTWYEECQPAADKLSHICICHAIHDLNMHKPYSIPDILRMNDFTVEVAVKHKYYATQSGRGEMW